MNENEVTVESTEVATPEEVTVGDTTAEQTVSVESDTCPAE